MNLKAYKMEDYTFGDLDIKVGSQYCLCHQGDCEHIMIFDEIRLWREGDEQNARAYPLQTFEGVHQIKKCTICKSAPCKKVTYDDKLAPESPCFFCDECYHQLHYVKDETGSFWELGYKGFEVYPYFHE